MLESGQRVCFREGHRIDAAKLAFNLNKDKKSALIHAVKAFCSLSVTVQPHAKNENYLKAFTEKMELPEGKAIVDRITTAAGFDTQRKRGEATAFSRQAVIRTWPYKGTHHPGHAALSVKNDIEYDDLHTYMSWWPSPKKLPGIIRRAITETSLGDVFMKQLGHSNSRYLYDKYDSLSDRAKQQLIQSLEAREKIDAGEKTKDNYIKAALGLPRERQKQLSESIESTEDLNGSDQSTSTEDTKTWGTAADKVYIPLMGKNSYTDDSDKHFFSMFGLQEGKMNYFWKKIENREEQGHAYYKMYSKHKNCAGVVLSGLEEGGGRLFTDQLWPLHKALLTPNHVHKVAIEMQEKVDALNKKSTTLEKAYKKYKKKPLPKVRLLSSFQR